MTRIIVFFITLFLFVNPVKSQQVWVAYVEYSSLHWSKA